MIKIARFFGHLILRAFGFMYLMILMVLVFIWGMVQTSTKGSHD